MYYIYTHIHYIRIHVYAFYWDSLYMNKHHATHTPSSSGQLMTVLIIAELVPSQFQSCKTGLVPQGLQ